MQTDLTIPVKPKGLIPSGLFPSEKSIYAGIQVLSGKQSKKSDSL
jgi:hypothetical protein